jgi:hypothetical protein
MILIVGYNIDTSDVLYHKNNVIHLDSADLAEDGEHGLRIWITETEKIKIAGGPKRLLEPRRYQVPLGRGRGLGPGGRCRQCVAPQMNLSTLSQRRDLIGQRRITSQSVNSPRKRRCQLVNPNPG